jgi:putative two-component system response regulator
MTDESALEQMVTAHQALTFALAKLADSRDPETGGHLYRVREYCVLLAKLLRNHPKYRDHIDDEFIENIYLVAPLHDIGKVAIPDGILLKKGRLTDAEFEIMSKHTTLGAHAVDTVLEFCDFELFRMAKRVILCHHERYDGLGYPRGVSGEDIPLEARIMTLADIYDALLSARVYKPAFSYEEAKTEIREHAGSRFDPDMVEVMLAHMDEFEAIHQRFSDDSPDFSTVD